MLDQDGDEALDAAEDRAVNDHRPVLGVVGADVLQIEALRVVVIELNRRALPLAANGVLDVAVDLRAVERAVAGIDRVRLAGALERLLQRRLGAIPDGDIADEVRLRTRRQLRRVLEAEVAVDAADQPEQHLHLRRDLLLGHEAVAIVLRELADAREAREHAGRFVAMERRLLMEAQRQVLVAAHLAP